MRKSCPFSVYVLVASATSCGRNLKQFPDLNISCSLEYFEMSDSLGKQVIVPQMMFDCHGYVTNWTAHTLILTRFIRHLPHTITFQVWRPHPNGRSYSLVGSNTLKFAGTALRDGITSIPGTPDMGYFSFNERMEQGDQIHFVPGDVVGWFIPQSSLTSPPSVLYVSASEVNALGSAVTLYAMDKEQEPCTICDIGDFNTGVGGEVVPSVIPLMAAVHGECQ